MMNSAIRRAGLLASTTLLLAACGRWHDLPLADGAYTLQTPPGVTLSCEASNRANEGGIQVCQGENAETKLVVIANKLETPIPDELINMALNKGMVRMAQGMHGEVNSSKAITINGIPGRDFTLTSPNGLVTSRIFVGKGYTVDAAAFSKNGQADQAAITRFIASLQPR